MERLVIVVSLCLVLSVFCAPVRAPPVRDVKEDLIFAKEFMSRFGYLDTNGSESESLIRVDLAIKDVQKFGNIPQTGKLDNSTLQLMKSPRCGLPDIVSGQLKRNKRYVLAPTLGWKKRHLTYFIANWSPKIGQQAVRTELQRALGAWANYGKLNFQEVFSPNADIIVSFGAGYHGDPYPFDGPGSTLAHAFFPGEQGSFEGDIHFDDDEAWRVNPGEFEDAVDFFTVAVHEVGHSLGLSHSPEYGSIMNPYYRQYDSNTFSLGYDDILAMYELYITSPVDNGNESWGEDDAARRTPIPTVTPRTIPTTTTRQRTISTTQRPKQTTRSPIVTYVGDDESVEFHKSHDPTHRVPDPVEPLTPQTPTTTTPSSSEPPNGCDGNFDAVSYLRRELFIFKNEYMWRLADPGKVLPGYPVPFQRMFTKLPSSLKKIDAAYERSSDSNLIFFSGDKYWVHNGNDIVSGSPRSIYDYGLPKYVKKVDAIMVWDRNKKTYIFSGDEYWRFNETTHTMDSGYPKSMERFRGVPSNLGSAMTWSDGITYFFKNNWYWAFNNTWLKTEPLYPQQASQYWLGCN